MLRTLTLVLFALVAATGCGEDPPPPPPVAPPPPPEPVVPPQTPCEAACERAMACDLPDLGDRNSCLRRCMRREARDAEAYACLEGARRCDLARRCTEVWVERLARPAALVPEGERVDARALGPALELSLESRLLNATTDSSRYELMLLIRGRAQWDGGLGAEDAGPLDAGVFDGGLAAPDLWIRIGAYTSDGRLPLVRVEPQAQPQARPEGAAGEDAPLFVQGSYWARTGDYYRVRRVRDTLVVEHAFLQTGPSRTEQIESDFEPRLRIQLTPGATLTTHRELVP